MKHFHTFIFLLTGQLCFGNMASPVRDGTFSSSALSSKDIDILREKIYITIDRNYKTAQFSIEYIIKTDIEGKQIPLLFHAVDYAGDFKVWVDNRVVPVSYLPSESRTISNSRFPNFSNIFEEPSGVDMNENDSLINPNDLKYFETPLTKGQHKIRVEYIANAWVDLRQWVGQHSFRYSLSPAKLWRSFGTLEVILDATHAKSTITTDLGNPTLGKVDSISVWRFKELPGEYFEINFVPEMSSTAKMLLRVGPSGLTSIFCVVVAILHLFLMREFRRKNPQKKYSRILVVGSFLAPFLILVFNLYSYDIIDRSIGEGASRFHPYAFLVFFLYLVIMPLYLVSIWLTDKFVIKKFIDA